MALKAGRLGGVVDFDFEEFRGELQRRNVPCTETLIGSECERPQERLTEAEQPPELAQQQQQREWT